MRDNKLFENAGGRFCIDGRTLEVQFFQRIVSWQERNVCSNSVVYRAMSPGAFASTGYEGQGDVVFNSPHLK